VRRREFVQRWWLKYSPLAIVEVFDDEYPSVLACGRR